MNQGQEECLRYTADKILDKLNEMPQAYYLDKTQAIYNHLKHLVEQFYGLEE